MFSHLLTDKPDKPSQKNYKTDLVLITMNMMQNSNN